MRINIRPENCKFYINKENRKITCVLDDTEYKLQEFFYDMDRYFNKNDMLLPKRFIGIATCHENDEWNEDLGKRIAFSRAKSNFYRSFFKRANNCINKLDIELDRLVNTLNDYGDQVSRNVLVAGKRIQELIENQKQA